MDTDHATSTPPAAYDRNRTAKTQTQVTQNLGVPDYRIGESGPDPAKQFTAEVLVEGEPRGDGEGRSKKEAEQQAAEAAWTVLSAQV